MLKRLFIKLSAGIAIIVILLIVFAIKQSNGFRRDPLVLMNKYYQYKQSHPEIAKEALHLILRQDANDLPAMVELSQWLLSEKNYHEALSLLVRIHQRLPGNDEYTYQLGYVYYEEGRWADATRLFQEANLSAGSLWKLKIKQAMNAMASFVPSYKDEVHVFAFNSVARAPNTLLTSPQAASIQVVNQKIQQSVVQPHQIDGLAKFYLLKKHNEKKALTYLEHWIKTHPTDVTALKEAGFLCIKLKYQLKAREYFIRAYELSGDPALAMQIGYLYNDMQLNKDAYRYFQWATKTQDAPMALSAENALTHLVGQQTKILPTPYYGELFAMPFTQSRFGLTVTQWIARLGVEQANRWKTREYVFSQTTQDNQSRAYNLGKLSQIYEDDVQIIGLGAQLSPLPNIPLLFYGEMGVAYDLVYRQRDRARSDFRGGLMYYQEFGKRPAYYNTPKVSVDYYSTWYGDATYFSRYNNNVIGVLKTHQGVRALQYKSSIVNLYARGLVVQDVQRLFYNNFAEIGPGIGFIPSNRYNFEVRFDYINGVYLPAGAINNPYGKYYTNKLVQLLFYVKI